MGAGQFINPIIGNHMSVSHRYDAGAMFGNKPPIDVVTIFSEDHGFLLISGTGTSIEDDLVNYQYGTQGLKLVADTTYCQVEKVTTLNLLNKDLHFDIYVPDVTKLSSIHILLETAPTWSRHFTQNILSSYLRNGWNTITIHPPFN